MVLAGCAEDPAPAPTPTAPPPPAFTPPADDLVSMTPFWKPVPSPCGELESLVELDAEVAALVRACAQPDGASLRLINLSDTSLSVDYDPLVTEMRYTAPATTELLAEVLSAARADARIDEESGIFTLPAGESVTALAGNGVPAALTVAVDPEHGAKAFFARATTELVAELPWSEIGDLPGVALKVAGCAGGALAAVQDGVADGLATALEIAVGCKGLFTELSEAVKRRDAALALRNGQLLARAAEKARPANGVADRILSAVPKVVQLVPRI